MPWHAFLRHVGDGKPHPPRPRETYERAVSEVARALDGLPWALTGTLANAFRVGTFWRDHADIDVHIPEESLLETQEKLKDTGYALLARKHARIQVSPLYCLQVLGPITPTSRYLRLYNPRQEGLARLVDVFAYRETQDRVYFRDPDVTLPLTHPLIDGHATLADGTYIPLTHAHYIETLKEFYPSGKHEHDSEHMRITSPLVTPH